MLGGLCTYTISVLRVVRDLLGSAADSVPAASVTVSASSSRTCPHSGRSRLSETRGNEKSCSLETELTFEPTRCCGYKPRLL